MGNATILNVFDYSRLSGADFYILAASAVLLMISSCVAITRAFHMLQQDSYFNSRFIDWCKSASKVRAVSGFFCFAVVTMLVCFEVLGYIPVLVFSTVVSFIRVADNIKQQKKAIKPLVFTGRVKRLYTTVFLIAFALILLMFIYRKSVVTVFFISSLLLFAMPLYAVIINIINSPIEKLIALHYVNDARRILKKHAGMQVLGVTGSYGKTGTKFILGRILSEKYNVTVTPENYNTTMGVVRTVREHLAPETEIFVCEMGARRVGDIKEISKLVKPNMGIITSIGPQHLNTFFTMDNIVKTKFELADSVFSEKGKMFFNTDNKYILEKAKSIKDDYTAYGIESGDFHAENITVSPSGSEFDVVYSGGIIHLRTRLLGKHSILNITAGVAVAKTLDISDDQIRYAVSSLESVSHRLELKAFTGGSVLIDDAYNANPDGCLEAVNVLGGFEGFKKIIVTPGLVDLGEKEYECNKALGKACAKVCDEIYFIGLNRSAPLVEGANEMLDVNERERIHTCASFKDALSAISGKLDETSVVLFENDLPDNYLN